MAQTDPRRHSPGSFMTLESNSNQVELVTTGFILPEDLKIGKVGGRVDVEVDYFNASYSC